MSNKVEQLEKRILELEAQVSHLAVEVTLNADTKQLAKSIYQEVTELQEKEKRAREKFSAK
ncbi:hypothetical protein [Paraliobacillus zengyii]|uniref:hypothetical protein n=1 Tax=Paraliobacillus zengyii TaxID=2213194 RepID=UPI000DD340B9|nr:hypothetical protein [Paraliobacillus zengyii]